MNIVDIIPGVGPESLRPGPPSFTLPPEARQYLDWLAAEAAKATAAAGSEAERQRVRHQYAATRERFLQPFIEAARRSSASMIVIETKP